MKIVIKLIIAVLLLGCLAKMPYGYYQFIRIATCIGLGWLAFEKFKGKINIVGLLCLGAAILLNPIFKIYLGRKLWNEVDLILAISLIVWVVADLIVKRKNRI